MKGRSLEFLFYLAVLTGSLLGGYKLYQHHKMQHVHYNVYILNGNQIISSWESTGAPKQDGWFTTFTDVKTGHTIRVSSSETVGMISK